MTDDKPTGTPGGEFYRADMTREAAEDIAGKGNVKPVEPTGMHKDCPDEDGKCYMNREADCRAFEPTGLTDVDIDQEWLACRKPFGSMRIALQVFARRIEAIVRADQPSRASTMEHDIELMIRKDERERAAGICNAMTGDSDATAAIRRGEEGP